LVEQRTV